jgi:transcriptional regulator with XRE-family HTH domain
LQELALPASVDDVQNPTDFVREQVSTVRGKVDQLAGSVAETVAASKSEVSATGSQVGDFIREQRSAASVSLRELARTAGVSNPYLSQVERGLRKPSAEILAAIAKGLRISAETLYEQAGILDRRSGNPDTVTAIRTDEALSERHRAVLLELYETYAREHAAALKLHIPNPTPDPSKESA